MAKDIKRHIQHLKNGSGVKPTSGATTELLFGEIAVGYKAGEEALYILDSNSGITEFNPTTTVLALAESYTDTKIGALDGDITGTAGAGKTLTAFTQTDGKVTAKFGNISITKSQVSDFPTIGNGSFTISGNGTSVASTSANATGNTGLNIKPGSNITITTGTNEITIAGKAGTVTKISTGAGLKGGDITSTGTVKCALSSETNSTLAATSMGTTANRQYAVGLDKNGVLSVNIPWTNTTYTAATAAPPKVATNSASGTSANYARQDHTHGIDLATGDSVGQVKIAGTNISVNGFLPSETSLTSTSDAKIPTSKAVADYISQQMASALTYKGAITSNDTLKPPYKTGDLYVVSSAGTYAGKACEVGDYLIAKNTVTAGTSVINADWDAINGENQVTNSASTLADNGGTVTIANVDGTDITITTPSSWTGLKKVGTVTKISTGAGLKGGDITSTGTVKCALSSETKSTLAATSMGSTSDRQYAVGLDKNGVLSVNIPWTDSTYTVNDGTFAISGNGTSVASTSANASANSGLNIKNGTFVTLTTGTSELTIGVSTGTSSSTLARGDHSHSSYATVAFKTVKVSGATTVDVVADAKEDTITFAKDDAIKLTGDATNDKVTFGLGDIVCGDYA